MIHRAQVSPFRLALTALFGCGVVTACSGAKPTSPFIDGPAGGKSATDNADGGAGEPSGSPTFGGADGGVGGGDAACAAVSTTAKQQQLDIYIMLDQSGSMSEEVSGGTRWAAVSSALTTFVNQPSLTDVGVGLQYFGLPPSESTCPKSCKNDADCGMNGPCIAQLCVGCLGGVSTDSCNAADYAKPEVEIGALPGAAAAITASIAAHGPTTGTPTSAALQGAVDHAKEWATGHPGHVTIALFATDGEPSQCDMSMANINAIAAAAAAGTPKVLTFVIGVGTSLTSLNGIAMAGGTGTAYIADTSANVNQQFLDALNKIRTAALGCQYEIPLPKAGGELDYGSVNVKYAADGGMAVLIPKVDDKSTCPATGDAWYYDDNTTPTQIILCDESCKSVTVDLKGELSIDVGCSTVVR